MELLLARRVGDVEVVDAPVDADAVLARPEHLVLQAAVARVEEEAAMPGLDDVAAAGRDKSASSNTFR